MKPDAYPEVPSARKRKKRMSAAEREARETVTYIVERQIRECLAFRHAAPDECALFEWMFGYVPPDQHHPGTQPLPDHDATEAIIVKAWPRDRIEGLVASYMAGRFKHTITGVVWKPETLAA